MDKLTATARVRRRLRQLADLRDEEGELVAEAVRLGLSQQEIARLLRKRREYVHRVLVRHGFTEDLRRKR